MAALSLAVPLRAAAFSFFALGGLAAAAVSPAPARAAAPAPAGAVAGARAAAPNSFDEEVSARRAAAKKLAGRAEAVVPLLGILDLWPEVENRGAIVAFLDEVSADLRQREEVRTRAAYLRSIAADRLGDVTAAERLRSTLGFLAAWQVVGPFDDEGRAGDAREFPPETRAELAAPLDFKKEYAGKERPVRWRRFPDGMVMQGLIGLDAVLRPEANGLAYATTWVRVERDVAAAVRVGSSGAIKVWCNGQEVLARDAYRPVRLDQDAAGLWLKKGWNRVTLKVGGAEAGWAFFARLTAPDGGPLSFQASATPDDAATQQAIAALHDPVKKPRPTVAQLGADLRRAAPLPSENEPLAAPAKPARKAQRPAAPSATALRNLGLYLYYVAPDDPALGEAERALERSAALAPSTVAYRLLGMVADGDRRHKDLEQAVAPALLAQAPAPERARVLTVLGSRYAHLHRERRAEELWRAALAAEPNFLQAELAMAELLADQGLPARAQARLDELAQKHTALAVAQAAAALADRRGLKVEAERRYRALLPSLGDDLSALRELYAYARNRGDVDAALQWLDAMARARPDLLSLALDRADLFDGLGRGTEAHQALSEALANAPDDTRLLERDGRVLHRLGRDDEALASFRKALELRPQNPDLRAYLRDLERRDLERRAGSAAVATTGAPPLAPAANASGDDLAREYARPVAELIQSSAASSSNSSARDGGKAAPGDSGKAAPGDSGKAAAGDSGKAAPGDGGKARPKSTDSARVLLDLTAVRVHPNGLSETFSQRVVEVLDERGAREQGTFGIRYTPDSQSVQVKAARVYKKNGDVLQAVAETDQDTSEPWYGLYYDTHAEMIEMGRLAPGDVVDVEYVVSDVGKRNLFADYYGELHVLQEDLARRESEFVLITPKARSFYFNQPPLKNLSISQTERGDERIYRFHATDVPKVEAEPGMPGPTDVAAYIHISTYRTWEEVAKWYQGLVRSQLEPDDAIRKAVAAATRGITDERQKIRAVYDLVVKQTRYVGLEFGIHGYKPYSVSQVYARKFGDCKDKASLLVAMLREVGVQATLVLARTRRGGDIDPYPASLAPFDHAIAYVPKYDLFLDGTAEFSGSDELPAQDQDISVLLVSDPTNGGKGRLARTPVLSPAHNRVERDLDVKLGPTGSADVALRMKVAGQAAQEWRSHYQSPGERRERFEKAEGQSHPGAKVTRVDFPELDNLEQPVTAKAEMEVPTWARIEDARGDLAMPALGREPELSKSYARLSQRTHDLVIGYPWEQEERVSIALPKGYAPRHLPESRRIDTPFGSFSVSVEQHGQDVEMHSSLKVLRHRIRPAEYAAFRRFCLDVDAAIQQELVIGHP